MLTGHETLQQAAFSCCQPYLCPCPFPLAVEGQRDACATPVGISQQGRNELAGMAGWHLQRLGTSSFRSGKTRLAPGEGWDQLELCWEEEWSYEAPEMLERKHRALCKELTGTLLGVGLCSLLHMPGSGPS